MYDYYVRISESLVDQQIGGPSMGWLFQTLKETRALSKLPSPNIPCITFCGVQDSIVDRSAVEDRMACWPHGKFELVHDAKHDVLYEIPSKRDHVFAKIEKLFFQDNLSMPDHFKTKRDPSRDQERSNRT